jgi:hypothetical protein
MMRGIRRLAACAVATGLLAAGAVTATTEVAHANFASICSGDSGNSYACTDSGTVPAPQAISVTLTASGTEDIAISWKVTCTSGTPASTSGGTTASVAASAADTEAITPLPATNGGQCTMTASMSLTAAELAKTGFTPSGYTAELDYTPVSSAPASAIPTPTPTPRPSPPPASGTPVHPIKGFGGKCVDDKGNSSANRAAVVIWSCGATDQAESWKYGNSEFVHNGLCLNDRRNGGSGSKVILYRCNGGANEKWTKLANGELKLAAHGGTLCLDDPGSSTKNGTQLIVYTCKDSANQKWSLP